MADYYLEGVIWPTSTITWSFATSNVSGQFGTFSSYFQPGIYAQEIVDAFQRWSVVANISFVQVSDSAASDIRFGFGNFDGPYGLLAETDYYYSGGRFLPDVTIRFDQAENYYSTSQGLALSGGVRFETVALHEIGHALGLAHYDGAAAIMNTYASGSVIDLTQSDIHGITALYGARQTTPAATPDREITVSDTQNNQTWAYEIFGYDAQNRLNHLTIVNDDGTRTLTYYNPSHAENFQFAVSSYNSADQLTFVSVYPNDPHQSLLVTSYDPQHTNGWRDAISGYDASGALDYVTVERYDGTSAYTKYDHTPGSGILDTICSYDAAGHLTSTVVQHQNGQFFFV